jgi:peptide/nickel transport system permease protein
MTAPPPEPLGSLATATPLDLVPAVAGRSVVQIAWRRLRRDHAATAGAVVVVLLIVAAIAAPLIVKVLGQPPDEFHQNLIDPTFGAPKGRFGGVSVHHLFGLEPINGRDLFSRTLYGARISLLVAFGATLLSVTIGTVLGVLAGYRGGWVDAVIARTMDVFLAFPLLLFALALGGAVQGRAFGLSGTPLRVALLIVVIGFFNWPYIGRIVRGQTLSLREREFIEAARSLGAGTGHILFRELLPNLVGPILVYGTLLIPTNILFEAALSFFGVGVTEPTPSWGGMLTDAVPLYTVAPGFVIVPGAAIFVTVLAFNLLGDGLRDALDPRSR